MIKRDSRLRVTKVSCRTRYRSRRTILEVEGYFQSTRQPLRATTYDGRIFERGDDGSYLMNTHKMAFEVYDVQVNQWTGALTYRHEVDGPVQEKSIRTYRDIERREVGGTMALFGLFTGFGVRK
jgi:hypothetical protein